MTNLITFEQAKRLNELGYRVPSAHGYYTKGKGEYVTIQQYREDREYQLIPSWLYANSASDALQWIRDEKGIVCGIDVIPSSKYPYQGKFVRNGASLARYVNDLYSSYQMAESALLDELLTYLEENNYGNK